MGIFLSIYMKGDFLMKKMACFWKSLLPVLFLFLIQIIATIPVMILFILKESSAASGDIAAILGSISDVASNQQFLQTVNIVYGILALLFFGIWYQRVFVKPFRNRPKKYPTGYTFHTIVSMFFLGIGLQYVTTLLTDLIGNLRPEWIANYNATMETQGYSDLSVMLIVYSVIMAPIIEELIFRGLIFRYARHAMPFWLANIWQALFFAIVHLNLVQGIYAFAMGLFLGWVCRRGHGIRYSIPVHIVFNIIGCFFSGMISASLTLSYPIFAGLGVALTIFALWLFYTDFQTAD